MVAVSLFLCSLLSLPASPAVQDGGYRVLQTAKVGGEGGFDYVYADSEARKLYVPRMGPDGHISVFDLDTLKHIGGLTQTSGHGVAVDERTHRGFATSNPVAMWDSQSLNPIKTIHVDGRPDGLLGDPFNHRIYIWSHSAPNATVIDANDGSVLGTIDLGGEPEQAATDNRGHIYVDLENKGAVAVVDARNMKVEKAFSLGDHGGGNAGLALDARNHVLFVACREPKVMVMIDSNDGHFLASLPIGDHCDGVVFNPRTMECFSSQGDGTLTVIKETNPTTFTIEQTVQTAPGAKTLTMDRKTGHILLITAQWGPAASSGRGRGPMVPDSFSIIEVGK